MEQERMRRMEAMCIQEQPPACVAACPVHVDARGISAAIAKGDFAGALAIYKKAVPFPAIIGRVCDAPCQNVCKRNQAGGTIRIRDLERACVEHAKPQQKRAFIKSRDHKVAVAGGGLSGLTAAVELARKGYTVTLFEAGDRLGGSLLGLPEDELPYKCIEDDLKILETLNITVRLNERVGKGGTPLSALAQEYDAVYVATGRPEGVGPVDETTLRTGTENVFAGGRLRQKAYSPINAVGDGRRAAISIDRLLQGVSLTSGRENEGAFETTLFTETVGIVPEKAVVPANGGYTEGEAVQEAQRCIQCECMECVKGCAFLAHYKSYPKRYVREVYNNLSIVMGTRHANGMINACSLCGQCGAICPSGLNMAEVFCDARREMVAQEKMPPSAHDFALRDLAFSNSDAYFLARHQPGRAESRYVFFPGCQLGASAPDVVKSAYLDLAARLDGGVGLMLGCCGVIADWAGREQLFEETLAKLREAWEGLGRPEVIAGCPTCFMILGENIPGMRVRGLWDVLEEAGLPSGHANGAGKTLAVQDACTTRGLEQVQDSIRRLAGSMGYEIEELKYGRDRTLCCGYGGLTGYANPEVAREMAEHSVVQSDSDYLTYCANCRDRVAKCGKPAAHILELLYPAAAPQGEVPGYSARRENRERLKTSLLRELWEEDRVDPAYEVRVEIEDALRQTLEDRMILTEDIARTVAEAEETGSRLRDSKSGICIASRKLGAVTYWVWYSEENGGYRVHNAYSHRMEIEV
jgi:glutamate synthase (NADPH/NADH) small chain